MEVPAPDSVAREGFPWIRETPAPAAPARAETPAGPAAPRSATRVRSLYAIVALAMLVIAGSMARSGEGMDLFMAAVAVCFAAVLAYLAVARRAEDDPDAPSTRVAAPSDSREGPASPSSRD